MALTGKFTFRKSLWGRIILQVEEEVKPLWRRSDPTALKRRWRDATLMDLAAPELRPLIDLRFRPHLFSAASLVPEAPPARREREDGAAGVEAQASLPAGAQPSVEVRRIAH